ncbi:acyltransferase [Paraflavitalea soli]|uniref:Acyltransferase n=1 Tax=Paraflavitalea soli TaxID=2315862 RepID=A0A3B7MVP4_9BACT|nr:acyltransferase [Paraflavitalea soli]
MYIAEATFQRKHNNFDALRLLAALGVFISHGYGFTNPQKVEPLYALTGRYLLSTLGLFIFFSLSGFLICRSLNRSTVKDYLWNRILRICPAIAICSLFTILVTGCIFTNLPVREFLFHVETWHFLVQNSFPVRVVLTLPGVLDGKAVNASLWTIPLEIKMYLLLLLAYLLRLFSNRWLLACSWSMLIVVNLFFANQLLHLSGLKNLYPLLHFGAYFLGGAVFYLYRDKIPVRFSIWLLLLALWLLAWKFFPVYLDTAALFFFIYTIIGVGVSSIHIPFPRIDISYGFYLYAFPVQRSIYAAWGDQPGYWPFTLTTFLITTLLATASWFLIEKRALSLKKHRSVVLTEKLIGQPEDQAYQYKQ